MSLLSISKSVLLLSSLSWSLFVGVLFQFSLVRIWYLCKSIPIAIFAILSINKSDISASYFWSSCFLKTSSSNQFWDINSIIYRWVMIAIVSSNTFSSHNLSSFNKWYDIQCNYLPQKLVQCSICWWLDFILVIFDDSLTKSIICKKLVCSSWCID